MESATVALGHGHEEQHGPPEANQSSRIDKQTLGILLFIVSEVMLFGAFFASYFFLRVVVHPTAWPPHPFELPVAIAGMNTAILVSSSFTVQTSRSPSFTSAAPRLFWVIAQSSGTRSRKYSSSAAR